MVWASCSKKLRSWMSDARCRGVEVAPATLRVGVAQMALEGELAWNRDKIVRLVREASEGRCRVVVFPESALCAPPGTPAAEIESAVDAVREAARAAGIYVIVCIMEWPTEGERPVNSLQVIDPGGEVVRHYHKLFDVHPNALPGVFQIDGIACSAIICADRWIRGVEDLPAAAGAQVLFECSNNYASEWVPDLGWYWYVPRALRNGAYVVFANTATNRDHASYEHLYPAHGHSAVIAPDGTVQSAADEGADQLLVTAIVLTRATRREALTRCSHPVFRRFWDVGLRILGGDTVDVPPHCGYTSPEVDVTLAAAQMACSCDVAENVTRMVDLIQGAKAVGADIVVFPELAVTGTNGGDIERADPAALDRARERLQAATKEAGLYVAFGIPHLEGGRRQNCALVLGPDGAQLTRYAQVVVDRRDLFEPGTDVGSMWFWLRGVPCVVSVGRREALWNEIAELAAAGGAQVHLHLGYDTDVTSQGALLCRQLWVTLASYRTLTLTVNACSADDLARPSAPAIGGSTIWDDYRERRGEGPYPYCAVPIAEAGSGQELIYAMRTVRAENPHYRRMADQLNPQMRDWYSTGVQVIRGEV